MATGQFVNHKIGSRLIRYNGNYRLQVENWFSHPLLIYLFFWFLEHFRIRISIFDNYIKLVSFITYICNIITLNLLAHFTLFQLIHFRNF